MTPAALAAAGPAGRPPQSRGIGTLPGGIPIYEDGELVGGIGVFFPGTTGYANEENSSLSANYNPSKPDLRWRPSSSPSRRWAAAAAPASRSARWAASPPLPGFDLPVRAASTWPASRSTASAPAATRGRPTWWHYAKANLGVGQGDPNSGTDVPVDTGGDRCSGRQLPCRRLAGDAARRRRHDGRPGAADHRPGHRQANADAFASSACRWAPPRSMVFAVADSTGDILGLYRMPDATVFSIDVAVAKARNVAYYDDPDAVAAADQVPGLPPACAAHEPDVPLPGATRISRRASTATPAGPFSILNDPGINPTTGLDVGPPLPASAFTAASWATPRSTRTRTSTPRPTRSTRTASSSSPAARRCTRLGSGPQIVGGFGVSGDGVNQDDFITANGIAGFAAPAEPRGRRVFRQRRAFALLQVPTQPHQLT